MELADGIQSTPGSTPSIVKHFSIEGLHGYRNVSLTSEFAATILIAKNGAGKTTLLAALDAFLRGQFLRLSNLRFDRIRCRLLGVEEELVLESKALQVFSGSEGTQAFAFARHYGVDPWQMLEFVTFDYQGQHKPQREITDNEVYQAVLGKHSFSHPEARSVFDRLWVAQKDEHLELKALHSTVRKALAGIEIVYLPTYRRIELPLSDSENEKPTPGRHKQSIQSKLGFSRRGLFNPAIQFGLSDIGERLERLNHEIVATTNQGYGEISAGIINELLDGTFDASTPSSTEIPDQESLEIFFERVREGRRNRLRWGYRDDLAIPDLNQINQGRVSGGSEKFLLYFLGKLNTVVQSTRAIEGRVEDFVNHCNAYLSAQDPSTSVNAQRMSSDDKELVLNRRSLAVDVWSKVVKKRISIDALSSGEKQMVSLFARLYLYTGPKIVLMDEPELSLSIDWQRKILVDVVKAPTCAQIVAITHSPFVFENELEPYAKALDIRVNPEVRSDLDSDLESELDSDSEEDA